MDSLERAQQLNENGQYTEAYQMFLRLANTRNAKAMLELGMMYGTGKGVEKSEEIAVEWFHKAAILGNAAAQVNLGIAYEKGMGVQTDLDAAIEWYKKAAEIGSTRADANLADMYSGKYEKYFNPEKAIHHICSWDKGKQGFHAISMLRELNEKVSESIENSDIEGNIIYLRQRDAKAAADACLSGKRDYTSSYILLKDIIFFPEIDDSVISEFQYDLQCSERRMCTTKELRVIPCYEIRYGSKTYGRFAYLIEEDIPVQDSHKVSAVVGNPLMGGAPSLRSIKRQLETLRNSYNEKFTHISSFNPMSRIILQVELPKMQDKFREIRGQLNRIDRYSLDASDQFLYSEVLSLFASLKEDLF